MLNRLRLTGDRGTYADKGQPNRHQPPFFPPLSLHVGVVSDGAEECMRCPLGRFAPQRGLKGCRTCARGEWTTAGGSSVCR